MAIKPTASLAHRWVGSTSGPLAADDMTGALSPGVTSARDSGAVINRSSLRRMRRYLCPTLSVGNQSDRRCLIALGSANMRR